MYSLFCAAYTGYQSTQGLTTRFKPCASTSPTLLPSILLSFYPSTPLWDTSVHPRTHAPYVFLSSKLSQLVKEHSPSQAQLNGIYCLMDCDTLNLLLLKQLSKSISSDLRTNLLYLLDVVCVCVHACVRARADPIILVFVPGVEYEFLCVRTMWCESCLKACISILL